MAWHSESNVKFRLIDNLIVHNFDVEVGMMDYGFDIDAIIGLDFLVQVGAVIDLKQLEII